MALDAERIVTRVLKVAALPAFALKFSAAIKDPLTSNNDLLQIISYIDAENIDIEAINRLKEIFADGVDKFLFTFINRSLELKITLLTIKMIMKNLFVTYIP
jgi:hypothetical protein